MHSESTLIKSCILLLSGICAPLSLFAQQIDLELPPALLLPAITFEDGLYTIFDRQLGEHVFQRRDGGSYTSVGQLSGTLSSLSDDAYLWVDDSGRSYYLTGSQSIEVHPENSADTHRNVSLKSRTVNVMVNDIETLSGIDESDMFLLDNGTNQQRSQRECEPAGSDTPDKDTVESAEESDPPSEFHETVETSAPEITDTTDEPEQCDTSAEGPYTFQSSPFSGPNTPLDARPASCQSYFVEYYGTDRGFEIEAGLHLHAPYNSMEATLRNFPVIDFIDDDRLYVVHSRDLGNRTFNSVSRPDALLEQLLKDGQEIQTRFLDVLEAEGSISASELGQSTTITSDQLKPITLQLIIRDGIASASHWQQIEKARRELMIRHGILLEVVVIP